MQPYELDLWFTPECQQHYMTLLSGRIGLTRRRAECFVRLWAYLSLKQQQAVTQLPPLPISRLQPLAEPVACSHREAAQLFYTGKDQGSDRAAGMMLDKLVALGLIDKQFDGNRVSICIRAVPELAESPQLSPFPSVQPDAFNPRTDAIPIASLLTHTYGWLVKDAAIAQPKIIKTLRAWAQQYPTGMRVLRRCDNLQPVGMSILFPVASESEANFFRPPAKSFYLTSKAKSDPFQIASLGDVNCTTVFERFWIVDSEYLRRDYLCQFLEDAQATLTQMKQDFPNLCDLYIVVVHPIHLSSLATTLGFQKTGQEASLSAYWMYQSIDRFLALDMKQVLGDLQLEAAR
ncbi:hypothetical protein H6F90_06645 [Trichocoleus sp. FACHB-591]|uniref:hypothetical protein n=1 Tax=Trichocoleus sp. FACHB-591 TaxID=2692872 RepID=UPI0016821CBD|nr:hypothetical protein [Trichocoleus sp. FACHB-591]MBD2094830.1 hypothetical protein [Trichocoleus sp. FACHB-591]